MPELQQHYLTADTDVGGDLENVIPMTANDLYPMMFPGYVGVSGDNVASDGFIPKFLPAPESMDSHGTMHIAYDEYGESGEVNRNAYGIYGPVEPNQVEDFQLYGNVLSGQRRPEYASGPVGSYDHGAYTAMQVAQQMSAEAYTERSIMSLLTHGV